MTSSNTNATERIISALSYITMGFVGFIWLLMSLFIPAVNMGHFLRYHIFQSIFISIGFVLLQMLLNIASSLLSVIPFINKIVAAITYLLNMPAVGHFSLIQACVYALIIYLAITSFTGKYSYVPWISEIIDQNVGR